MSTIGILQIRDDIISSNGYYCSICFHMATERRLVKPVFFKNFLDKVLVGTTFKKRIKVCYICESLARSAVRFCESVILATKVTKLYKDINSSGMWQEVTKCLLDEQVFGADHYEEPMMSDENKSITTQSLAVDQELRSAGRYTLHCTDTLVVSSGVEPVDPQPRSDLMVTVDGNNRLTQAPLTLVHNNPVSTPSHTMSSVSAMSKQPSDIPPSPNSNQIVTKRHGIFPSDVSVLVDQMQIKVPTKNANEFVLYPMVKGVDGKLYVPSLQLQIMDNNLLKSVPDTHLQNCLPSNVLNNPQFKPNAPTYVHKNPLNKSKETKIGKKTDEKQGYLNFLQTQYQHKNINASEVNSVSKMDDSNLLPNIYLPNINGSNKKRKVSEPLNNCRNSLSDVQHILSENLQGACEIKYELIDDELGNGNEYDGSEAERHPVLQTNRTVDWEDKIPMDVISFMDATDPNPEERIMQPPRPPVTPIMGVISDVRTLDPLEVKEEIECIDLC